MYIFAARHLCVAQHIKKGKGFPYWIPSVGRRADPSVQAVSLQVTVILLGDRGT